MLARRTIRIQALQLAQDRPVAGIPFRSSLCAPVTHALSQRGSHLAHALLVYDAAAVRFVLQRLVVDVVCGLEDVSVRHDLGQELVVGHDGLAQAAHARLESRHQRLERGRHGLKVAVHALQSPEAVRGVRVEVKQHVRVVHGLAHVLRGDTRMIEAAACITAVTAAGSAVVRVRVAAAVSAVLVRVAAAAAVRRLRRGG